MRFVPRLACGLAISWAVNRAERKVVKIDTDCHLRVQASSLGDSPLPLLTAQTLA